MEDLIDSTINAKSNLTLDCFLNYLEFFKTMFLYQDCYYDTNAKQIHLIINSDCDRLGYRFIENDNICKVMLKNPEAEAV